MTASALQCSEYTSAAGMADSHGEQDIAEHPTSSALAAKRGRMRVSCHVGDAAVQQVHVCRSTCLLACKLTARGQCKGYAAKAHAVKRLRYASTCTAE